MSTVAIGRGSVVLSGSFLFRVRSRTLRSVGVRLCLAVTLAALGLVLAYGSAVAQCIDYSKYLHVVGSVWMPDDFFHDNNYSIALAGNYAYAANGWAGLRAIDITNPESPVVVGSVDTRGSARAVTVAGNHLYVAEEDEGLEIMDITNPGHPHVAGSVETPGEAYSVAVAGNYAYVADYGGGLQVVRAQCSNATAIAEPKSGDVPGATMLTIHTVSPNPFNPVLEVSFESQGSGEVTMEIYDASGSRVRTVPLGVLGPGAHQVWWDGRDASGEDARSGVYFVRLRSSDGQSRAVKAVLVR